MVGIQPASNHYQTNQHSMAHKTPVYLNIYDLSDSNDLLLWCGLGIFHSGIQVHGVEFAYGGHDYEASGIFATSPKDAPGPVVFRQSVLIGETTLTAEEVQSLVQTLGQTYKGNRYHLLQRNCNHFASDLSYQLCGQHAPGWVNRLANIAVALHCLLPAAWYVQRQSFARFCQRQHTPTGCHHSRRLRLCLLRLMTPIARQIACLVSRAPQPCHKRCTPRRLMSSARV